jgi:hypothetical protein
MDPRAGLLHCSLLKNTNVKEDIGSCLVWGTWLCVELSLYGHWKHRFITFLEELPAS